MTYNEASWIIKEKHLCSNAYMVHTWNALPEEAGEAGTQGKLMTHSFKRGTEEEE